MMNNGIETGNIYFLADNIVFFCTNKVLKYFSVFPFDITTNCYMSCKYDDIIIARYIDSKVYLYDLKNYFQPKFIDIKQFIVEMIILYPIIMNNVNPQLLILHGSSIEKNGKAILYFGNSMVGKSTIITNELLNANGLLYIADDILCIDTKNNTVISNTYLPILQRKFVDGSLSSKYWQVPKELICTKKEVNIDKVIYLYNDEIKKIEEIDLKTKFKLLLENTINNQNSSLEKIIRFAKSNEINFSSLNKKC